MKKVISILLSVILVFWLAGIVFCILAVRNPFWAHRINAVEADADKLMDVYSETAPYVYIEHVDLEYTGFYSVHDEEIVSYCFVCSVGETGYLVELSAEKVYTLTTDVTDTIEDVSLTGKMSKDTQLLRMLANEENTDIETYRDKYGISDICILQYGSGREQEIIYYMLAILTGGIILTGAISTKQKKIRSAYEK